MNANQLEKYLTIRSMVAEIIQKAKEMEVDYAHEISQVHSTYQKSAVNLIHYLAFRSFNIDYLQRELDLLSLPTLTAIETHVMRSLIGLENILNQLLGDDLDNKTKGYISLKKSEKIMRKHNKLLFGYKSKKRNTRIMVTLPSTAATDKGLVDKLVSLGMNCARINCAHDDPEVWGLMINNIKKASRKHKRKVKIAMDLGGPKLRTGAMVSGPKVIHIKPKRDDLGRIIQPANVWISLSDILPPEGAEADNILPVNRALFNKIKRGNTIFFIDSRNKKGKIIIDRKDGKGFWGLCSKSVYLETGTDLTLHKIKQTGKEVDRLGELIPKEQFITLFSGDQLILHSDPRPGESAHYDEDGKLLAPAHISCTLPEIFNDVQVGEPIFFDDGKIEGIIESVAPHEIRVRIYHAKDNGSKLKADKGINLPSSSLSIRGLTPKDRLDLEFVSENADAVNFSFVNSPEDVSDLYNVLEEKKSQAGIILKIETQKAFANLPGILLEAMRRFPVGVMIARGDLAIETGWKNFATIQQEIMRICRAAHIPDVWATQVLENLAKKGTPSRAEITDAALAQQASCVMLNKGPYIHKAVKMLHKILRRMQKFQHKSDIKLPRLEKAEELVLSHQAFDIS